MVFRIIFTSLLLFLNLLFSNLLFAFPAVPNPNQTSGVVCTTSDPDFTEFRYREQIAYCERHVSSDLKKQIYEEYGIPKRCRSRYTIDHFIPLALGGNNSRENLWPEHKLVKATRPRLENDLYWEMERGRISQADAIQVIVRAKLNPPAIHLPDSATECDR